MTASVFVDTDVFAYERQTHDARKQSLAAQWLDRLWQERNGRTSMQVLCEYYAILTRKFDPPFGGDEAWEHVRSLLAWNPPPIDAEILARAYEIQLRHRLNWWDCLIVSSAQQQRCSVLLTEDLQDGAVLGGVTVRNPFVLSVADDLAAYVVRSVRPPAHPPRGRPRVAKQARAGAVD